MRRQPLAVLRVKIPAAALGQPLRVQQHAVQPAHLPVEELHPQRPFARRPVAELRDRAEEARVRPDVERHAGRLVPGAHVVEQPPLARFRHHCGGGPVALHRAQELAPQGLRVGRVVERDVVDRDAARLQRGGEVAHGRQHQRDLDGMVAHVGALARHLGHQHHVAGRYVGECRKAVRALVAEHEAQRRGWSGRGHATRMVPAARATSRHGSGIVLCARGGSERRPSGGHRRAMHQLLLLRHAKSSWDDAGIEDHERPLNLRGRAAAAALRQAMQDIGLSPDLILVSTARRTRETLDALEPWDERPLIELAAGLYLATPERLLETVNAVPVTVRSLMLVGHNPGLHEFALQLVGESLTHANPDMHRLAAGLPTGCLLEFNVAVQWSELRPGGARLQRFLAPRDLPTAAPA